MRLEQLELASEKLRKQINCQPFTRTKYEIGLIMVILARVIYRIKSKNRRSLFKETRHMVHVHVTVIKLTFNIMHVTSERLTFNALRPENSWEV